MRREVAHLTGEGEYFHRLDAELAEHLGRCDEFATQQLRRAEASARRQAELDRQCVRMADALKIRNSDILHGLQEAGYTPATVSLVYLIPLVRMAWADGSIARSERKLIGALASLHGVRGDTPASAQLMAWLDRRPSERFLQASWHVVQSILEALPTEESNARKDSILQECRAVAAASGRILHRIGASERKLLAQMERELLLQSEVLPTAGFP